MGYFSRLAVELLEDSKEREDRELIYLDEEDQPMTNQRPAAIQQEEQYSIWNEEYRKQLEQASLVKKQQTDGPKVYQKKRS